MKHVTQMAEVMIIYDVTANVIMFSNTLKPNCPWRFGYRILHRGRVSQNNNKFTFACALCMPTDIDINLSKPTGYVMHQQFNIQQLYVLPTLYLFVLYLSENKQRLVPLTA